MSRLESLKEKHLELDTKIDRLSNPYLSTDYIKLTSLKKEKLKIKEQIMVLEEQDDQTV
jgi:hypothetical protein